MAFNVENGSGSTLDIEDLGITLDTGEITDLALRGDPAIIAISAQAGDEISNLITSGDLIIKDPFDGTTNLVVADGLAVARSINDPHWRLGQGARIGDISDVTLTAAAVDDVIRFDGAGWVNSTGTGGFSGYGIWRYRTDTTSNPTSGRLQFDNVTIDSATELYVNAINDGGTDMTTFLGLITSGELIYLQVQSDASKFVVIEVGTSSLTSGVYTFPISNIEAQGTAPLNNDRVAFVTSHGGSGGSTQDLWETISSDSGSTTANTPTDTLTVAGGTGISTAIVGDTLTITATGGGGGDPDQNLWETMVSDSGSVAANITTDTFTIAGGTSISTSITGDTLTIVNDDPNVDQNLWNTIQSDSGSVAANIPTDTLIVAGGTGISTSVSGDTITITNDSPNADQNLWETMASDSGTVAANITTDTFTIAGGAGISTAISGDTLTVTATSSGDPDQNLWETMTSDSGSAVANNTTDTFTIAGGTGISTSIIGDTLTITTTGEPDQNLWETMSSDSGSVAANTTTDTFTIAGGAGISTAISGDTLTITSDATDAFIDMQEPTGFVNRTDSEFSFDVGTRTFTLDVLAPATDYEYYIHGVKFTISTTKSVIIPDTTATYHFYMDNTETLQVTTTFDEDVLLADNAYVANLVWNDTPSAGTDDLVVLGEERHGITMDAQTHIHFHQSFGAQYINGLGLTNVVTEPGTPTDTDAQFTVANGEIRDEDLRHEIIDDGAVPDNVFDLIQDLQPTAQIPVWFRTGATGVWNKAPATSFPFIYSDGVVFTGGVNGLLPWNEDTGATWQLTESADNAFVLIHYFATNDVLNPVIAIQGITNYNNKPAGREQALNEINQLSGLPFLEFTPLATIIIQARSVYTNTPLVRFRLTDDGFDYVDWRDTDLFGGGGGGGTTQNLWETITSDSGSAVANSPNDNLTIAGGTGISTAVSGDTLTITSTTVASDELVKVSANDTTAGYLEDKVVGVTNETAVTTLNDGGDEDLEIGIADNPILPGTEGVVPPVGTTGQRPGSPDDGEMRFNATTSLLEYYNGTEWVSVSGTSSGPGTIQGNILGYHYLSDNKGGAMYDSWLGTTTRHIPSSDTQYVMPFNGEIVAITYGNSEPSSDVDLEVYIAPEGGGATDSLIFTWDLRVARVARNSLLLASEVFTIEWSGITGASLPTGAVPAAWFDASTTTTTYRFWFDDTSTTAPAAGGTTLVAIAFTGAETDQAISDLVVTALIGADADFASAANSGGTVTLVTTTVATQGDTVDTVDGAVVTGAIFTVTTQGSDGPSGIILAKGDKMGVFVAADPGGGVEPQDIVCSVFVQWTDEPNEESIEDYVGNF